MNLELTAEECAAAIARTYARSNGGATVRFLVDTIDGKLVGAVLEVSERPNRSAPTANELIAGAKHRI